MNKTIFNVFRLEMDVITAYSKWAESQASNDTDLIILAIFPAFLLGLQYWLLPFWLCKTIAVAFLIPPLWVLSVSFLTNFRWGNN
jgi:hypothetical protein